jgi:hypothetical protein
MTTPVVFLQGVCAASAWAVGLFFLRFWFENRDRLFALFAVAFWLLALSWTLLALTSPLEDSRPFIYGVRLLAFVLIIAAIVDKNRTS